MGKGIADKEIDFLYTLQSSQNSEISALNHASRFSAPYCHVSNLFFSIHNYLFFSFVGISAFSLSRSHVFSSLVFNQFFLLRFSRYFYYSINSVNTCLYMRECFLACLPNVTYGWRNCPMTMPMPVPMPIPMPISMTMAMAMLCPCPCPNARVRSHGSNLGRLLAKKPQQIVCQLLILTVEKVFFRKTF